MLEMFDMNICKNISCSTGCRMKRKMAHLVGALYFFCSLLFVKSLNNVQILGYRGRGSTTRFQVKAFHLKTEQRKIRINTIRQQMTISDKTSVEKCDDYNYDDELFSVAPMMGHTNRHYRYFFRLVSSRSHLYTEMIPSKQIWAAYQRAVDLYFPEKTAASTKATPVVPPHPEEIIEVLTRVIADPSLEYHAAAVAGDLRLTLHQLLATSSPSLSCLSTSAATGSIRSEQPVVLQLGGNDPTALAAASAIGAAWGVIESSLSLTGDPIATPTSTYSSINLNCGCPSNAVRGRSGGCALMETPDLVARCVEAMKDSIDCLFCNLQLPKNVMPPTITVKHRLGVREASTFDAIGDRLKNDDKTVDEVSSFIRTVSLSGAVPKFHVHTRLGLLGEFSDEDDEDSSSSTNTAKQQSLWVPGTSAGGDERTTSSNPRIKIDHKRQQEKALKRARRATIKNREVPPLRPDVVPRLAQAFPHLQFVANGGIDDLNHVKRIVDGDNNGVLGAMVGRTVINHPCSFVAADWLLWGDDNRRGSSPTRGEILADYIAYCELEEARIMSYGASAAQLEYLRRRLIAVPYHLFTGEQGSDAFQRRIQKLLNKVNNENPTMKSASVLVAASSFVPRETLDKSIEDFVPWEDVAKFEIGLKRGSALQRVVY